MPRARDSRGRFVSSTTTSSIGEYTEWAGANTITIEPLSYNRTEPVQWGHVSFYGDDRVTERVEAVDIPPPRPRRPRVMRPSSIDQLTWERMRALYGDSMLDLMFNGPTDEMTPDPNTNTDWFIPGGDDP